MKRFLAVVGAVAMVLGAVVIRSRIDGSSTTVHASGKTSGPLTIACVTELRTVCDALRTADPQLVTRVEDASVTATALSKGTAAIDGWLTLDPWPDIANGLLSQPVITDVTTLASSPLVIALVKERALVLTPNCASGTIGWKCVVDAAGRPWTDFTGGVPAWGTVRVGLPPLGTALGLLLYGNAVSGYVGHADFATNDLQADPGFAAYDQKLRGLATTPDAYATFVLQFPAAFSAAGATAGQVATGSGVHQPEITPATPAPTGQAIVVLAPLTGPRAADVARLATAPAVRTALQQQGWTVDAPAEQTGLPDPGVLLALSGLEGG